ncbi:PD-(D/E)XK nuclease-like domain-containing protein [Paenibacillus sp. FSL R7-0331]|uniref:PD-(D/E)XK nuclease-like domain-containing protein n=1 Tax=Paenibacillus sp. FSL R7-0331 TaxID=1536773 RepID=UPI0009DE586C|nr:PD-(D/E)XK nuclease-like domain-containing protein [Paenibacillus sp. FSL R7-0331]
MTELLKLTKDNYFSPEASRQYMSVSQFKSFVPAYGGCEAAALAKLAGDWEDPEKDALEEGKFIHAWNEGTLEEFKESNPQMYSSRGATKGELKANFKRCLTMIEVLESDPMVKKVLAGEKEVILTAELFGIQWKAMLDSYQPGVVFADLKAMKDMDGKHWNKESQAYENFIEHYGYSIQMAVYAEVERKSQGRAAEEWLLPHMVVVTKQDPPDHEILYFDFDAIAASLRVVGNHIERVKQVKSGEVEPVRCESCEYCRVTKQIKRIKHFSELSLY